MESFINYHLPITCYGEVFLLNKLMEPFSSAHTSALIGDPIAWLSELWEFSDCIKSSVEELNLVVR